MPVIENADLSTVSTEREPLPEAEYLLTITATELSEDKKTLVIKKSVVEPTEHAGKTFWEYINLIKNDGKQNGIGMSTIKRHLEAVFGKGSAEANAAPPDTDPLVGHQIRQYLTISSYKRNDGSDGKKNEAKRTMKA